MSYSPKHPSSSEKSASSGKPNKTLIAVILGVTAIIVIVLLVFIFAPSDGSFLGINGSGGAYVPETQDVTTIITPYYENGILPTSGSRHDVTVIEGGGAEGDRFTGKWVLDSVTVYEFDGKGRGIMLTAVDNYTFRYSAQDNRLAVDFDIDDAMDGEYTYSLSGDKLTLSRGGQTYNFTKETP